MREHPILFSDELVRAILEGRKTQTRRPVKPSHLAHLRTWKSLCDFRNPGDHLWVRECWSFKNMWVPGRNGYGGTVYRADGDERETPECYAKHQWHPSIHMPRDRCRLVLKVTDCRIMSLQDISLFDARREGWPGLDVGDPIDWFYRKWDLCYGNGAFKQNPLVWVYDFEEVTDDQFKGQFAGCLPKEAAQ